MQVTGTLKGSARGQGTLSAPQIEATIEAPNLTLRDQVLDGLKIRATLAGRQAEFSVDSSVLGNYVQARGNVNLNSDYDATVHIDTHVVQLGPFMATYLPGRARDIRGQTELHGWLKGPLKQPQRIEAHLEIPTLGLGFQSLEIANASPIRVDLRSGTLTLEPSQFKGNGTDLRLQATVSVGTDGALQAAATGSIDLKVLQLRVLTSTARVKSSWTSAHVVPGQSPRSAVSCA